MSVFNEEKFREGLVSELSLFDLASTQTSVTNVYNDEIRPMSQTAGDSPFEFRISGQSSMDYLDLKNSQIYVKCKLEKLDGTSTGELTVDKVGPANLFLQALFLTVEVTLQNKATFTCNYNPYRAYIQTVTNYGSDAATSHLTSQIFAMDTANDKVEVKSVSIATGSTTYSWDNMFQERRPNKLIMGFVKSKAVSWDYKTNPFNFENCSIQKIAVYCDGLPVGGNPLKLDFNLTKGASFIRAYNNLLLSNGKWGHDEGNQLSRGHFEGGSALFVFQIEPDFSHHGEYLSLVKTGNVRLDVVFKTPLS
ncbi:YMD2-like protein, partial [Mya arenaria]